MYQTIPQIRFDADSIPPQAVGDKFVAEILTNEFEAEVLNFLAERPLHTVTMIGFIRDNGLVSSANRGTFYGVRNAQGRLEGAALIGHATLMETRTDRAVAAFAAATQRCSSAHMILGERKSVEEFWSHYEAGGQQMRLACRESLFELRYPIAVYEGTPDLRLATLEELDLIVSIQAQMALDESGINPLETDPDGFRRRCQRRIKQGRTWVLAKDGELLFKADIISDTEEAIYLEGIWTNEKLRGKGTALKCMSQLAKELLQRTKAITLLVDERNMRAKAFYLKCGFRLLSTYDTIFLEQEENLTVN